MAIQQPVTQQANPDYILPIVQALLFIGSVYLQKFVRKTLSLWPKQYKELSRILFVTVLTLLLMAYSYSQKCQPYGIGFGECFYLGFSGWQCGQVLVANTILFGYQIWRLSQMDGKKIVGDTPVRKLVFAPLLEQLLFRSVFYRSSGGNISIAYLSAIFAIAHLHRHIRKALSGKARRLGAALFQMFFTFIFSLYCYYFLALYQSVVPCIVLHAYCNLLGSPILSGRYALVGHLACLIAFSLYLVYVV